MSAALPRPSSTVLLLRNGPESVEVLLLVRRPSERDPFSGASVFPGGVVDERDFRTALFEDTDPAAAGLPREIPADQVHAFLAAGCRELFEEAGILMARDRAGLPAGPGIARELAPERRRLQAGEITLDDLLAPRHLVSDPSDFVAFAHWITPEAQPKRWDTFFFVAPAPDGQSASSDGHETAHAEWLTPRAALETYREGAIILAAPTFRVLEDLATYPDRETVLAESRLEGPPPSILPVPLPGASVLTLVYPGDAEYPGDHEDRGRNRLVLDGGRWRSERSPPL